MTLKWRDEWGGLVTLSILVWLGWRITFNVDLSDESYYAIFLHDWWIGGIRASTLATLHQTAALVVYSFVWIYAQCVGGLTGLILLLRILYLIGALAGAVTWLAFLRALRGPTCGWLAAATLLGFVPFGLPAPSYNTLGLQGLTVALGAFGCAALAERAGRRSFGWLVTSATGWAVAVVAYPTMALALCGFCGLVLIGRKPVINRNKMYVALIVGAVVVGVALVVAILTPAKLLLSITYLSQINGVTSLSAKVGANLDLMRQAPRFIFVFIAMVLVGLLRPVLPLIVTCGLSGLGLLVLQTESAVFFMRSHDALLLAALSGVGLSLGLRTRASEDDRLVAIVIVTSLVAGLATAVTATNGAFNFCIGAAPAGVMALAAPQAASWTKAVRTAAQAALLLVVMAASASKFYGDDPADLGVRERLSTGVFAGLNVQSDQARLIGFAAAAARSAEPENTIAEFGRLPGLILATQAKVLALTPFPLQPNVRESGLAATRAFYDEPRHRPRMILTYSDQYTRALNPIGAAFPEWYSERSTFDVNGKTIKLYILNSL